MTDHILERIFQIQASDDLSTVGSRYKVVTWAGAIAANNLNAAGVLKFNANSGNFASVVIEGLTKAYVGAAVSTVGWALKATTSGWLIAASSGDVFMARLRDATAASGDLAGVYLDFGGYGYKANT